MNRRNMIANVEGKNSAKGHPKINSHKGFQYVFGFLRKIPYKGTVRGNIVFCALLPPIGCSGEKVNR